MSAAARAAALVRACHPEPTAAVTAVATALALAGEDDLVHVTGSLYVVGSARAALRSPNR